MIHRMDPPADPQREPMPERIVPMLARAGELPARGRGLGVRDQVGRRARDRLLAARASCAWRAATSTTSPTAIPSSRGSAGRSARTRPCSTARSSPSTATGGPSFAALQRRMHVAGAAQAKRLMKDTPVTYMIFDLLWLDGHSLMALPYAERRELLARAAPDGRELADARARGRRGRGAARRQRRRRVSRAWSPSAWTRPISRACARRGWLKIKSIGRQEFVVGGWMPGKGRRSGDDRRAAARRATSADGGLRYVGRVGSGFSDAELERLSRAARAAASASDSPFDGRRAPAARGASSASRGWWSRSSSRTGRERAACGQPSYKGAARGQGRGARSCARSDARLPRGARRATAGRRSRASARRTASALAARQGSAGRHAQHVGRARAAAVEPRQGAVSATGLHQGRADRLLRGGRPGAARPPAGASADGHALARRRRGRSRSSRSRRPPTAPSGCGRRPSPARRKPIDYILADDRATLVWLANLAAIELHAPLARAAAWSARRAVVFDLDPGAPAGDRGVLPRGALLLQGMFEGLGPAELREDLRLEGPAGVRPAQRPRASPTSRRSRSRRPSPSCSSSDEPELVVSRMTKGAARRARC